jgi:hypothetical protein
MALEVGSILVLLGVAASAANGGAAQQVLGARSVRSTGTAPAAPLVQARAAADAEAALDSNGPRAIELQAPTAPAADPAVPVAPSEPAPPAARKPAPPAAGATETAPAGEKKKDEPADAEKAPAGEAAPAPVAPPAAAAPAPAPEAPAGPVSAPAAASPAAPAAASPAAPAAPAQTELTPTWAESAAAGAPAPGAAAPSPNAAGVAVAPAAQVPEAPPAAPPGVNTPVPSQPRARGGAAVRDDAAAARVTPENALPPGQIAVPGGFSIAVSTQMSFGQSTFQTGSSYARDPMVDWSLSLSPSFLFSDGTRLSAGASLSQELTQSNGDDDPQIFIFSDVGLNASRPIYRFEKGPMIFGSLSVQVPTSESSRVESLITSVGARLTASQPVGGVFLSLGSGFRKNFHEYTHPVRDPRAGDELVTRDGLVIEEVVTGLARSGGSELAGATYFDGASNNTSMIWSNSLSAFWPVSEKLGLGLSYNLSHSWTYESYDLDELSGVGASGGRGRRDSHGGGLFANYQALDHLAFGLGMATGGPTRTADDKRIRFPFFALEGPESNMTTFFISATYTESIPL